MAADMKSLARRMYGEVISEGDLDAIDDLFTDGFVEHEEMPGLAATDREGTKAMIGAMRSAFPDLHADIEDMVGENDTLAVRARFSGTHKGEFMGVPASGKKVDFEVIDIVRFTGDRVAEHWGLSDTMTMMQQMGALPEGAPR